MSDIVGRRGGTNVKKKVTNGTVISYVWYNKQLAVYVCLCVVDFCGIIFRHNDGGFFIQFQQWNFSRQGQRSNNKQIPVLSGSEREREKKNPENKRKKWITVRRTGRDLGIKKMRRKKEILQNTKSDRLKSSQRGYYVYLYVYIYIYSSGSSVVVVVVCSVYIYIYLYVCALGRTNEPEQTERES